MVISDFNAKMRSLFVLIVMLLCGVAVSAQDVSVSGVVKDQTGEPAIGATIQVKGTTHGTITDYDGNFTLDVPSDAVLVVSYMGFKTQEITVGSQRSFNITLVEDAELLDDVVVIGYGVVKKDDATGSVTAIEPDMMNKGLTTNAQDMMQGKIAGVNVTTVGGDPGAGAAIRIRGGSSLSASNDPLIVIDGLAMDNNGIQGVSNPLAMVNPNDIETFTVLKDASATAIYGSRASNGVIIITTKKGRAGQKPTFSYEGNMSASVLTNRMEVMSASQYRDWLGSNGFENKLGGLGSYDTDWQKEIFRTAVNTDHNFNITGGLKNMPYRVSLGYTLQNGVVKTSDMNRVTASVNLSPSFLDDHLTFNVNAKGMYIGNRFADGGAVGAALGMDPTRPVYDDTYPEFGGYYQTPKSADGIGDPNWLYMTNSNTPQNPVALLNLKNDRSHAGTFIGNIEGDYKIHGLEDLRLHANFGADYSYGIQNTDISPYSYSNNYYGWYGTNHKSKYNLQFNAYAQYYKDFNENHHFDVMAGYEWQHFKYESVDEGCGYFRDTHPLTPSAQNGYKYLQDASESYLVSFFGRVNYIALNRYMITATVRGDGSSKFAPGKQWGLFPSVALGWKIKEEAFLKDVSAVSDLKLRLGWGITGQQDIGSDYVGLILYEQSQDYADGTLGEIDPETGDYIWMQTSRPMAYNLDLTWEKTTTYNAGLDFGFANNRITGSLDYYYRLTTDLISTVDVAIGTNFSNRLPQNIGSLSNQGVEFAINAVAIDNKRLKWDLGFNVTYNDNKIVSLNGNAGNEEYYVATGSISAGTGNTIQRHQEGYAANTFFVYETAYDTNGQLYIVNQDDDPNINDKDLVAYHSAMPKVMLGFQSKWEFYNFDLGFTLRANFGNYVYNDVKGNKLYGAATPEREGGYTNLLWGAVNMYDEMKNSTNITSTNCFMIDRLVEDGSFLRVDNITLGYTFNEPKIKARIFATVSNPLLFTKYSGLDPEVPFRTEGSGLNKSVNPGIDKDVYPRSMTVLCGLSLQF
ncbi:MAG: TonB-dependent receptor [bacterium]|uniref:TonB-dependent receptor n=1 Tax=Candidatus Aphodosoma intestinipullorum TaxID=2840674 RepID=A0A940IFJ5_9BACT|nr:TonB-dependent receptor [Candidatus Aphodosoma intestinipullorum]